MFLNLLHKKVDFINDVKVVRTFKRKKTITLRLNNGVVEILCPYLISDSKIKKILEKKKHWIFRRKKEWINNLSHSSPIGEDFVTYKNLNLKLVLNQGIKENLEKKDNTLFVTYNLRKKKTIKDLVVGWLKKESQEFLSVRVQELSRETGIQYNFLKIKSYSARWGSCSINKEICLNWKLIMLPVEIIDYVIIHELSHIIVPNHSKKFWDLVKEIDPNFKIKKQWLKENGLRFIKFQ